MLYKIEKIKSTYVVSHQGATTRLLLLSSVAFYKSSLINHNVRWKVEEDSTFLRQLIQNAIDNPSKETIEPLIEMEGFYEELHGIVPDGASEETAATIKSNRASAVKDLFSNGLNQHEASEALNLKQDTHLYAEVVDQPSLGQLVDDKRIANGKARFKWRNSPEKK